MNGNASICFSSAFNQTPILARAFAIVAYEGERLRHAIEANFVDETTKVAKDDQVIFVNPTVSFLHSRDDVKELLPTNQILESVIETRFNRPYSYAILKSPRQPDYYVIRITDRLCRVTYVSVFMFYEMVAYNLCPPHLKPPIFAPKFLVVLSDSQASDVLKSCLISIYEKMTINGADVDCLDQAIATIINYRMPPPGMSSRLNLGFGPPLICHTPTMKSVPKTGLTVYRLIQALGIDNTIKAFFSVLNQRQVVMYSKNICFLTESCEALLALFYPFEYLFIYAPVQTKRCLERHKTLENPTPFFIGICEPPSDILIDVLEKVVLVDLDKNQITIPPCTSVELNDDDNQLANQLVEDLRFITRMPEFHQKTLTTANLIEKQLRSCFLKFHASLICDYRKSLSAVRMSPSPRVVFDRSHFFGRRSRRYQPGSYCFLTNFVDIYLEQILQERKLPVRNADFFDELCSLLSAASIKNIDSRKLVEDIAEYLKENDKLAVSDNNSPSIVARYLASTKQCSAFPSPNKTRISKLSDEINYEIVQQKLESSLLIISPIKYQRRHTVSSSSESSDDDTWSDSDVTVIETPECIRRGRLMTGRLFEQPPAANENIDYEMENRLAIYATYIACIFAYDLKKAAALILNIPKTIENERVEVRRKIPSKLHQYCKKLTPVTEKQFWAIAELVRSLLSVESKWDENGIAAKLIPVLHNIQMVESKRFLYTAVQNFTVWRNELFWVSATCRHIAAEITAFHENCEEIELDNEPCNSVDVLAKRMERFQLSSNSDEMAEIAIAATWCKHFSDCMIAMMIEFKPFNTKSKFNDSGIDCHVVSPKRRQNVHDIPVVTRRSVAYKVTFAIEELAREVDLPIKVVEDMKSSIDEKIAEQCRYISNLATSENRVLESASRKTMRKMSVGFRLPFGK